jgi:hypothetical protein
LLPFPPPGFGGSPWIKVQLHATFSTGEETFKKRYKKLQISSYLDQKWFNTRGWGFAGALHLWWETSKSSCQNSSKQRY